MNARTFFMLLKATHHWHSLDPGAQRAEFDQALITVFNGFPDLRMSRFSVGAFEGRCSHLFVWTLIGDDNAWQFDAALQALQQQAFFAKPLFELVEVIAGIEDDDDELLPFQAFAA